MAKKNIIDKTFWCQFCKKHIATTPHNQKDTLGNAEHVICRLIYEVKEAVKVFINTTTELGKDNAKLREEIRYLKKKIVGNTSV